jgi:hypothetical protein
MATVTVYHVSYGCDTGCCGHIVEMDGEEGGREFHFGHPYGEDHRKYAEDLVREEFGEDHIADLDWENCLISDD